MKKYRENGVIGALLDEYEKSISELKETIEDLSNEELTEIVDDKTRDKDCRSVQTILSHVVESGYNYAVVIRKRLGEAIHYIAKVPLDSAQQYQQALDEMFSYNEKLFRDHPELTLEEHDPAKKIKVRWGQFVRCGAVV